MKFGMAFGDEATDISLPAWQDDAGKLNRFTKITWWPFYGLCFANTGSFQQRHHSVIQSSCSPTTLKARPPSTVRGAGPGRERWAGGAPYPPPCA